MLPRITAWGCQFVLEGDKMSKKNDKGIVVNIDVQLHTLKEGAAAKLFNEKFQEVLNNIANESASPTDPRKIILTITFIPNETRQIAATNIEVDAKLAKLQSGLTNLKLNFDGKHVTAKETFFKQVDLPFGVDEDYSDVNNL